MREKEDLRIVKTKASLYRSLLDLMKSKSFEDIKISEICSKALINRSTFYDHFNDKNELLQSMMYDMRDEFSHIIEMNKVISKEEYYIELLKSILDHIEDNKDVYSSVAKMNYNSAIKDIMIQYILENTLKEKERIFNEKNTEETRKVSLFYISGFINVIYEELKQPESFNKEKIFKALSYAFPKKNNKKST